MNKTNPKTIHLKDYTPTPYLIERVDLDARLKAQETQISSRLSIVPNPRSDARQAPLRRPAGGRPLG
jgi:aminopeptidase N